MKYYLIVGEASGDLHASSLMRELKALDGQAVFRCWGGDLMKAAGGELVRHYRDLSFMGFAEVLANIRTILKNFSLCREDLLQYHPDVVILVDYPGFNLRMARFAHKHGFRVFYYVSPQVWAWKQSRVRKIKKYVEHMFVILPFEKDFYKAHDVEVDFVGHPLLDVVAEAMEKSGSDFIKESGPGDRPVIALLPGSRRQEVQRILPLMLSVEVDFPGYCFVIAGAPSLPPAFYEEVAGGRKISLVHNHTHDLLRHAKAALVTSGTATLETALFEVPQVVCYRGGKLSYQIARRLVKVKYISLVNLIMDRPVVTELIQDDLNTKNISSALQKIVGDEEIRARMHRDYAELKQRLGNRGASARAAALMTAYLGKHGGQDA
jgi:lipid-A-disaccharide synthase